jgi:hypothetical protein
VYEREGDREREREHGREQLESRAKHAKLVPPPRLAILRVNVFSAAPPTSDNTRSELALSRSPVAIEVGQISHLIYTRVCAELFAAALAAYALI